MCFNLTQKNKNSKVSTRDIKIYKTKGKSFLMFFTPEFHKEFIYLFGKKTKPVFIRPEKIDEDYGDYGKIEEGYHGYNEMGLGLYWNYYFDEQFLSREQLDSTFLKKLKVYEFVIPKGTTYYLNEEVGELVAAQVIYKGRIKPSISWLKRCVIEYRNSIKYNEHEPGDS